MSEARSAGAMRWDVLDGLVKMFRWSRGAEIGVWRGETAAVLLARNAGLHLLLVDPWSATPWYPWDAARHERHYREAMARLAPFAGRFTVERALSWDAAPRVPDGSLDFVFVDGDHHEEAVARDLRDWWPKVQMQGALTGHDYNAQHPGVMAAVDNVLGGPDAVLDDSVWIRWRP